LQQEKERRERIRRQREAAEKRRKEGELRIIRARQEAEVRRQKEVE